MKNNFAVLGLQWGDEGKGKIVNFLSDRADAACRYQGGHNAGHTLIINEEKIVLHLLPSSICHKNALSLIGKGVVISCAALFEEIEKIEPIAKNIHERLKISPACSLIQPYHILVDQLKEKSNSFNTIGTTLRGIGPAYEDRVGRRAIRVCDIFNEFTLKNKLENELISSISALELAIKAGNLNMISSAQKKKLQAFSKLEVARADLAISKNNAEQKRLEFLNIWVTEVLKNY